MIGGIGLVLCGVLGMLQYAAPGLAQGIKRRLQRMPVLAWAQPEGGAAPWSTP